MQEGENPMAWCQLGSGAEMAAYLSEKGEWKRGGWRNMRDGANGRVEGRDCRGGEDYRPNAFFDLQHLAQAGWREEQKLWVSPVNSPKMFVASYVGTSVWGGCFPHSSSKEASKGLQWVQGSRVPGCTRKPSQHVVLDLGGASPL